MAMTRRPPAFINKSAYFGFRRSAAIWACRGYRRFIAILIAVALPLGAASAADWPMRPVRAVVPLTAGSATDIVARVVLNQLSVQLGQPIIVENRPGAGNTLGMEDVAKSNADGYTILVNSSSHTISAATYENLRFDPLLDLKPVIPLGNMPIVIVVSPAKGYKSLADLVAAAKAKPDTISYGSAGAGNFSHMASEVFSRAAGFQAYHIPSKGAPEAALEVAMQRVDFFLSPLVVADPLIKDGKLQVLAVTGSQRATTLPDVPTTVEAGYPNSSYNFWVGIFVPSHTPAAVTDTLYRETAKALQVVDVQEKLKNIGVDPMPMSAADFAKLVADEIATNTKIAKDIGLKIN